MPFVLFAYRSSLQSSTKESPFHLLYGRDPQLPTSVISDPPAVREVLDVDDYKSRLSAYMADAWELAQANVQRAQKQQKLAYDCHAQPRVFKPRERVFVFMPSAKHNKAYKLPKLSMDLTESRRQWTHMWWWYQLTNQTRSQSEWPSTE